MVSFARGVVGRFRRLAVRNGIAAAYREQPG